MAEVNDRGQLLLVGGIVLAIFFVALALLVNTAIYTDNVATRGGDSASEALDYQDGAETAIGGLLDAENGNPANDNISEIKTNVSMGTGEIATALEQQHLRRGASATLEASDVYGNTTSGLLIREDGEFSDWTVNASAVRNFVVEFDTADDGFTIQLKDTKLNITNDGDIVVSQGGEELCRADDSDTVTFDVTARILDGDPCRFEWPELDSDSQIRFDDGHEAGGSYELTVETDETTSDVGDSISEEAIYAIDGLRLRYHSTDVSYETSVRIAPGEPDV